MGARIFTLKSFLLFLDIHVYTTMVEYKDLYHIGPVGWNGLIVPQTPRTPLCLLSMSRRRSFFFFLLFFLRKLSLRNFCLSSILKTQRLSLDQCQGVSGKRCFDFNQSWALSVFFHFFNNKNFCLHFFQVKNLFLHQSYLKSPLPVKWTW